MRSAYCLILILIALPAAATELTIARIFGDPALSGPTPRAVQVSPDGRRVGLLRGRADDQHQLDLWSYDVAEGALKLRVNSRQLVPAEQLSQVERARRERERTADYHGIVEYKWAPDSRHVLFTLAGSLYLCDLDAPSESSLRQLTHGGSAGGTPWCLRPPVVLGSAPPTPETDRAANPNGREAALPVHSN